MVEMYAFIAAFTTKILILSVLAPVMLVGFLRAQIAQFIADRAPPIDSAALAQVDRRLRLYRTLGLGTAVIGGLLLVAILRYMLQPDWQAGRLTLVLAFYGLVQGAPLFVAYVSAGRFHGVLKRSLPTEKRKALMQPRGLFDFVSRTTVALAVLVYFLFIAVLLYVEQHPFPGFAGLTVNLVFTTLLYALMALAIYLTMVTMSSSALQAREDRMRSVRWVVNVFVYVCIAQPVVLSLSFTLKLLEMPRLGPALQSVSELIIALLFSLALREQLRIPETNSETVDGGTAAAPMR